MEEETFVIIPHHIPAYAIKCHMDTNHLYDKKHPYILHLYLAVAWGYNFIHLLPESVRVNVIGALWCHDVIEDARQTFNDVKEAVGEPIAELVYAVSNEKGKNRSQRANDKFYTEMNKVPFAPFVKLCDKLANLQYGIESGNIMMHLKEHNDFKSYFNYRCTIPKTYTEQNR